MLRTPASRPQRRRHPRSLGRGALAAAFAVGLAFPRAAPAEVPSSLWSVTDDYSRALAAADELAIAAAAAGRRKRLVRARELALKAADSYSAAAALRPSAPEPHYRAAETLYWVLLQTDVLQDEEPALRAIAHWTRFLELAPSDPRLTDVLFRRSIARSKLGGEGHLRRGIADYQHQLRLSDPGHHEQMALLESNVAELYMAVGELEEAIVHYLAALEHKPGDRLYAFGLAVAFDRDGQKERAHETLQAALGPSGESRTRELDREGVFFIPEGDIEYYRALAHESAGEWDEAASRYRLFLRKQPTSRYALRAKRNLAAAEKRRAARGRPGKRP